MSGTLPVPEIDDPLFQVPAELTDRMYAKVTLPNVGELTDGTVGGTGIFDRLMSSLSTHIRAEYQGNRITGSEYTKAYIAMTEVAMSTALQLLLGREQSFWQAQQGQIAAINARVGLEESRVRYATGIYNLNTVLPGQVALTDKQTQVAEAQREQIEETTTRIIPKQELLIHEQTQAQRAQSSDTRNDGAPVAGLVLRQRQLYEQQVESYKRDSEVKVAKIFADAWTVQKTVDEAIVPPGNFTNADIDSVLTVLKTRAALV